MLASSGAFHATREFAEHLGAGQRFGKDRVRARFEIELGARHRAVHAFGIRGIRARDDVEMPPCLDRGGDLGGGLARIGKLLVVQMAAFLRQQLVFDMDGRGARILEAAHHMHDVERFAMAGVAVDENRQARGARHLANEETDLLHRDDAEIGQPHGAGHRASADIKRLEPCAFRQQRRHAGMRARDLQDLRPRQKRAQTLSCGSIGQIGADQEGHASLRF